MVDAVGALAHAEVDVWPPIQKASGSVLTALPDDRNPHRIPSHGRPTSRLAFQRNRIIRYNRPVARTISATTAAKRFREVLNDVEHRGETFEVERHGRAVARIGPTEPGHRRMNWKEALARLHAGPSPDADFARDLEELRQQVEPLPQNPWARSSTAPS